VLELVSLPAFVVDSQRKIALLNAPGHALLEREPGLGQDIVAAVGGTASPRIASVTPLGSEGVPRHHVVLVSDDAPRTEARLASTLRDVGLSEAEARVFRCLVAGDANKDIATKLGTSVRTVEVHVTAILSKCRVDSRSRLIAWFWTR
jgi:DNA-binding NarL/FixJ family response regulator